MKLLAVFAISFVAGAFCDDTVEEKMIKYTSKFNNVDLDAIMQNDRLLNAYFDCLIEGKRCTPAGEELRRVLPEVAETGCEKCTEEHLKGAKKMVSYLVKNKPEILKQLLDKYDPDKKYRKKWADRLKVVGFDGME